MPDTDSTTPTPAPETKQPHALVRISPMLRTLAKSIIDAMGATLVKPVGADYYLCKCEKPELLHRAPAAAFVRWILPLRQTWPCKPAKTEHFIEKAAQTLLDKFGGRNTPQALWVGALSSSDPNDYFRKLASNLRGRALQLFPQFRVKDPEFQKPDANSLFCMVGKEGLFCGMVPPRQTLGFYPGGVKFVSHDPEDVVSRAAAKITEALHALPLIRPALPENARWLELGAAPGGMTSELLKHGYHVTAVDSAPMDQRVRFHKNLTAVRCKVAEFEHDSPRRFHALLCDMNGDALDALEQVVRLSDHVVSKGLVIFTLKLPKIDQLPAALAQLNQVTDHAFHAGLRLISARHLPSNRNELTLFFEKR